MREKGIGVLPSQHEKELGFLREGVYWILTIPLVYIEYGN